MTPSELLAELEQDIEWRERELNHLSNAIPIGNTTGDLLARRSAIPLIQAHSEGFTRFALQCYIRYVNAQGHVGRDAITVHAAWSLSQRFRSVRELLVDDKFAGLGLLKESPLVRRHYVETRFIDDLASFLNEVVSLDSSSMDRFEKNLDEDLLLSLLYKAGLDATSHLAYSNKLNGLVRRRNEIAHGEQSDASRREIVDWDMMLRELFRRLRDAIYDAASKKLYLKSA